MTNITFNLLGEPHTVTGQALPSEPSPHTGRPLRRLALGLTVNDEAINEALLAEPKEAAATGLTGDNDSRWLITRNSWSYQDGTQRFTHDLELTEVEALTADRLEFEGIVLIPTRYREEISDDRLVITAIVAPTPEDDEVLESLILNRDRDRYFPVRRVGVSDEPVSMRFGRCLWRDTEEGRAHLIILVGEREAGTPDTPMMLFEPDLSRLKQTSAANTGAVAALLNELQAAGVLNDAAVGRVRAALDYEDVTEEQLRVFGKAGASFDQFF